MTSLASLQRAIAQAVRQREGLGAPLRDEIEGLVTPSLRGVSASDRLEIYREQFWLRHLSNLGEDYPTLQWVLGASAFRNLATEYLRAFPPRTWNLERLGEDLPSFLALERTGELPLALDAVRLDWAFMEAFAAPDVPPFNDQVLVTASEDAWPGARIVFHPSVRPLVLSHPVHLLRDCIQRGESPSTPALADTHLIVWRDAACYLRTVVVEPPAFELLSALRAEVPLGAACERLAGPPGSGSTATELGPAIAGWFRQWTENAWVSAVHFG